MTLYPKLITDALATVIYPGTKRTLWRVKWLQWTMYILVVWR